MAKMKIFESAQCTIEDTPGSKKDSELMRIHYIINELRKNGIEVERYNIVYDETPFIENETVWNILESSGINSLPIIIVNEEVAIYGRYPSRKEFTKLLDVPKEILITNISSIIS